MLKKILLCLAAVFVALQFVRPEKNVSATPLGPDSLVVRYDAPPEIRRLLATACYDCHSNNTRYPWYAEIQPAGWFLASHVRNGKRALNLSTFATLGQKAQARRLEFMLDAMTDRAMPLPSYTWAHRDAILTDAQIQAFAAWAEPLAKRLAGP
jgi:hypothetical protein